MKKLLIWAILVLPLCTWAQIPAIKDLSKQAASQKGVKHFAVNSGMLGMAAAFTPKEQRETFKMLTNIEIIECKNEEYAPQLTAQALDIVEQVGAKLIGCEEDDKARSEVYAIQSGDIVSELIILITGHDGGVALFAMSGEIPASRLEEISKIKPQ